MSDIINVGYWGQLAKAILGVTGGNPILRVEPALRAGLHLGGLERTEWGFPGGEIWAGVEQTAAGGVAIRSGCGIRNDANSGALIIVEDIGGGGTVAALRPFIFVGVGAVPTNYVVSGSAPPTDARWGTTIATAAFTMTKNAGGNTGGVTSIGRLIPEADALRRALQRQRIVLAPNSHVLVEGDADNVSLTVTWQLRIWPLHKGVRA